MAISNVVQRGAYLEVYDENGSKTCNIALPSDGELKGFTSSSINIQHGSYIYVYDENGLKTGSYLA